MKYKNYLLLKLMEECAEVSQAASKCILFGTEPKVGPLDGIDYNNLEFLQREFTDLTGVVQELYDHELLEMADFNNVSDKVDKLRLYYDIHKNFKSGLYNEIVRSATKHDCTLG
jgi:hypothetical protein